MKMIISMKYLIFKLALPVTIIIMAVFTKSYLVLPVDGASTRMWGYPFPYAAEGWHTSLSFQIFVTELFADFLIQLLFWTLIIFSINTYLITIKIPKFFTIILHSLAIIVLALAVFIAAMPEQIIQFKRDWETDKLIDSGYQFIWENPLPKQPSHSSIK